MLVEPTATRADTVYVSNWSSDSIVRFTADGAGSIFYSGGSESFRPTGLTFCARHPFTRRRSLTFPFGVSTPHQYE